MAFSKSVTGGGIAGNLRYKYGTCTNAAAGDSGGDIATGLSYVISFNITPTSHVGLTPPKYSASGGTVTLITDTVDVGGTAITYNWLAWGV